MRAKGEKRNRHCGGTSDATTSSFRRHSLFMLLFDEFLPSSTQYTRNAVSSELEFNQELKKKKAKQKDRKDENFESAGGK